MTKPEIIIGKFIFHCKFKKKTTNWINSQNFLNQKVDFVFKLIFFIENWRKNWNLDKVAKLLKPQN
jgi:hypothetical protein